MGDEQESDSPLTHRPSAAFSFATLITFLVLSACAPPPQSYRTEFLALGTTTSITAIDASSDRARTAMLAAEVEIKKFGREWYPWRSDGELVRLNDALGKGQSQTVSPQLLDILQQSRAVFQLSEGAFDPALGSLVKLWGFDKAERSVDAADAVADEYPSAAQLHAWQINHATFADIEWNGRDVRSKRRDVTIDLGAIGKGYAVDRAIEILQRAGIHHALVNAGGNLRAIGNNIDGPWQIAIRDPRGEGALYSLALLGDESVSTSGDDQRFVIVGQHRWHHLLDPRSGLPAEQTIAVTVLAGDATTADAASTAIFIAGPQQWQPVARRLGVRSVLRIDASGHVQVTRALLPRLIAAIAKVAATPTSKANRDTGSVALEVVDL